MSNTNFDVIHTQGVPGGGTASISNSNAAAVFLVFYGTWNYSGVYLVFPNNNNAPKTTLLGKYNDNPLVSFEANGQWGFTIRNTSASYSQGCVVIKISK